MGEVYCEHDTQLRRDVALKVLPAVFAANAERLARFRREAQVLASLNHPGIAAIYGLEESEGVLALVMELVEGPTLAERISQGGTVGAGLAPPRAPQEPALSAAKGVPLQIEESLHIARQIAEALEYAHEHGVVHRDLKPANVKITGEGTAKVLDFGLAKALGPSLSSSPSPSGRGWPEGPGEGQNSPTISAAATREGIILGTAAYMSPEQAKGRPVDRRADIWAFGCLLYEMLTGEKAFNGETVSDVLASVIMKEPDWARLPSNSPPTVKKLLRRCLDKDSKRRLRDIGEARIAIEEYLGNPAAKMPEPAHRAAHPTSTGWLVGLSLAGLLVGAIVAGLLVWKLVLGRPAFPMHFSAVTNFPGVEAQPSLSPDGRSVAFASNRDGHYDIYVGLIAGGSLVRITNDPNLKARPRWSHDGTKIAYSRLNESGLWDIWEVPALGGTPRRLILNAMDPAWSPDGRSLAYANNSTGSIWIADSSGQNARAITQPEPGWSELQPSFSPDGSRLGFVFKIQGPYGELAVANLVTNKVHRLTDDHALALSPAWSPDSRFVYFASSRGGALNIWKIAASGGEPDQITAGQGQDAELDVSFDGKRIVFSTYRESINIAEVRLEPGEGGTGPKWLTTDPARNANAPAYSPDGKHLAYFSARQGVEREIIWVMDSDGSNPVPLIEDGRANIFPRWAPDGQTVFYMRTFPAGRDAQDTIWTWGLEIRTTAVVGSAPLLPVTVTAHGPFDVGPDGRVLLRAPQGRYQAFNPANNQTQTLITLPEGQQSGLPRWSPDGRSIAYVVLARQLNDPSAGFWVDDLKNPPRQLFRGWVVWYAWGRSGNIYLLEGKPDLDGVLWRLDSDGHLLRSTSANTRLNHSYWLTTQPVDHFDVSPDGRRIAIGVQQVYEADIGMIEGLR
jgi:serine/threonine-protein kinase